MKKHSKLYLALDVHARHCVLGRMNEDGRFLGSERFTTSAKLLIDAVKKVKSDEIILTLEEGTLAQWS